MLQYDNRVQLRAVTHALHTDYSLDASRVCSLHSLVRGDVSIYHLNSFVTSKYAAFLTFAVRKLTVGMLSSGTSTHWFLTSLLCLIVDVKLPGFRLHRVAWQNQLVLRLCIHAWCFLNIFSIQRFSSILHAISLQRNVISYVYNLKQLLYYSF